MAKKITNPEEIFQEFTSDYQNVFGNDLESIILYGSTAQGNYVPGKSDINFLIVLSQNGIGHLYKAEELAKKWWKYKVSVPLFLTESYIKTSLDTFPLEFFNMKLYYKVIFGKDILNEIEINSRDLRLQLEKEIKGKLLHLRQSFFNYYIDKKQIHTLLPASLKTFMAYFPAILFVKGEEIPNDQKQMLDKITGIFNLDKSVFDTLLEKTTGDEKIRKKEDKELFLKYIEEIRKLANEIDKWDTTKSS